MSRREPSAVEHVTVTHAGRRYRIERSAGYVDGTVTERFPGRGLIGSERAWRGHTWAKGVTWYAAVNPDLRPGGATSKAEGLPSRRAAVAWLLANAPEPEVPR